MTHDPMATAIDWLDAYRAGDLEGILSFYADDASIECECGGAKILTGREALRVYWDERLRSHPANDLDDLRPARDGASVTYTSAQGCVRAILEFDGNGRIRLLRCRPVETT
jgi:hypothetical protein